MEVVVKYNVSSLFPGKFWTVTENSKILNIKQSSLLKQQIQIESMWKKRFIIRFLYLRNIVP